MDSGDRIETPPLLLGRNAGGWQESPDKTGEVQPSDDLVILPGESHMLTIAPVAATRLRACIIPNLLTYPGSVLVVDPTGAAYAATSRARRQMGQVVLRLDPFRVVDAESDAINPFDLLQGLEGPALESASQDVAALLPGFYSFTDVWENQAFGLLGGVIAYLAVVPEKNRFSELYTTFHTEDVVYSLAVVLDTIGKKIPRLAYAGIATFLQRADAERSRIVMSLTSQLKALGSQEAQAAFGSSTVPLADIIGGTPVTVYLMMPPTKMPSHFPLLRIWIGTFLRCAMSRRARAGQPMLFLLDDCAALGPFAQLQAAMTLGPTPGLRVWSFWQDFQQLRSVYPHSWLVDSCGAIQAFGSRDYAPLSELSALLGVEPATIRSLAPEEQFFYRDGISRRIRQFNYRADPLFAGCFD